LEDLTQIDADFADFAEALYRMLYFRQRPEREIGEPPFTCVVALNALSTQRFCEIGEIRVNLRSCFHTTVPAEGPAPPPGCVRFLDYGHWALRSD
jgi:hypothetical protein